MIAVLVVAAFGPYVVPSLGLRTEHFAIYGLASYLVFKALIAPKVGEQGGGPAVIALLLLGAAVWTALSSVGGGDSSVVMSQRIAGFENFTQPATLFAIVALYVSGMTEDARSAALRKVIVALIVMLSLNSLVSLASVYLDTWPLVKHFAVGASGVIAEGQSSWERSASIGRYSGIFNQPIEAGLAYSVGIIGWGYLVGGLRVVPLKYWIGLVAMLLGGVLSVSKTFLFVGIPLGVIYWAVIAGRHQVFSVRTVIVAAVGSVALVGVLATWKAADYALRFFRGLDDVGFIALVELLTAGRYAGSSKSTVQLIFSEVAATAPIAGMGYGAYPTLESAYLQYFALGGGVALAFYVLILLVLVLNGLLGAIRARPEGYLMTMLMVLVVVAGFGGPVLTINRASVALVLIIGLTMTLIISRPPVKHVKEVQLTQ